MTDKEIVERKPLFKQGDILYEISDGSKIEIIDIVADQYKFECGDEYPHYEFFGYIESNYTKEPQVKESAEIERDKETCKENSNSLTKEPASNVWHDMSEVAENGRNIIIIDPKGFYGVVLRKGGSQLRNRNKERYVKWAYIDDIINITKKEEPVNDELEKAAVEAFKQLVDSDKNNFLEIFKAGAKWQKEKMMAKAVDGVVTFDYYEGDKAYGCVAHDSFCLEDLGLKDRDEVKILILKK